MATYNRKLKRKIHTKVFAKMQLPTIKEVTNQNIQKSVLNVSLSCPNLVRQIQSWNIKYCSPLSTSIKEFSSRRSCTMIQARNYAKTCSAGCPCPFPCGPCGCKSGCSCLPPPCNTPPKCIQYMTGYYYYPYGTWFCGPYHVSGTCVPVGAPGPCPCPCPCPCPKCCAAICVFPAGSPSTEIPNIPPNFPNRNPNFPNTPYITPKIDVGSPVSPEPLSRHPSEPRLDLQRLFPFKRSAAINKTPGLNTKPNIPPVISSIVCFPYCTRSNLANNPTHQNNESSWNAMIPAVIKEKARNEKRQQKYLARNISSNFTNFNSKAKTAFRRRYHGPTLEKPRTILNRAQRDNPEVKPRSFDYTSIPKFKRPSPQPYVETEFRPYDS